MVQDTSIGRIKRLQKTIERLFSQGAIIPKRRKIGSFTYKDRYYEAGDLPNVGADVFVQPDGSLVYQIEAHTVSETSNRTLGKSRYKPFSPGEVPQTRDRGYNLMNITSSLSRFVNEFESDESVA